MSDQEPETAVPADESPGEATVVSASPAQATPAADSVVQPQPQPQSQPQPPEPPPAAHPHGPPRVTSPYPYPPNPYFPTGYQPPVPGYGPPSPAGPYGAPQGGSSAPAHPYGPPPAHQPYGPPVSGGYGPPGGSYYGPPPVAGSYGAPPGGYSVPPSPYGPPPPLAPHGSYGYTPGYGGGVAPVGPSTSTNAIIAFVLALVGLTACPIIVPGIVALVLASGAQKEIDHSGGWKTGGAFVTAAKWIAWIGIIGWGLYWAFMAFFFILAIISSPSDHYYSTGVEGMLQAFGWS